MEDIDKINPLNDKDRELRSDLTAIFYLGTQTIIGSVKYEILEKVKEISIKLLFKNENKEFLLEGLVA